MLHVGGSVSFKNSLELEEITIISIIPIVSKHFLGVVDLSFSFWKIIGKTNFREKSAFYIY